VAGQFESVFKPLLTFGPDAPQQIARHQTYGSRPSVTHLTHGENESGTADSYRSLRPSPPSFNGTTMGDRPTRRTTRAVQALERSGTRAEQIARKSNRV